MIGMLYEKAHQYALDVVEGKEVTNKYVRKQCLMFLEDLEKQDSPEFAYYFDVEAVEQIQGILSLLNFATGIDVVGKSVLDCLIGFQAFFLCNIFGFRFKNEPEKFRYRDVVLFIPRKNSKTWLTGIVTICLLLTQEKYSEIYSLSLDRELAAEVKKAIAQLLNASPSVLKYFTIPKTLSGKIVCKLTNSFFQPRTADSGRNNGIRPLCYIADEYANFKDWGNIHAMQSGQLSVRNPLRLRLTTAYANDQSIMLEELATLKKMFEGTVKDERTFALLYFAEEEHLWDEIGLLQANPLRVEANFQEIRDNRQKAIDIPSQREEYLCKHMNHFLPTNAGDVFIDIEDVRKCRIDEFDWTGRQVYLGLDLSMTTDNCAVAMTTEEDLKIYADVFAFVPSERIAEKNRTEKVRYQDFIEAGKCFATGDQTVDYGFIEDFIMGLEAKYKVIVMGVAYDRYNCLSTSQRLEREAGLRTVEVKQHSSVLHPATKLTREKILNREFGYTPNDLLEINFQNAKIMEDANRNIYVHKKRSTGKVDCVVALINSVWLLQQDVIFNPEHDWAIQVG